MRINLFNPNIATRLMQIIQPIAVILFIPILLTGLYYALIASPPDYQQGEMVRVMYVHVPSAWMSLGIYSFVTICSILNLVFRIKLAFIFALAAAPIGAIFSAITLITGSIWGKPIWGAWWVWDARLTSMLVLFLIYLSYIIVATSGNNLLRAEKPASVIAIIGFINVPIVKFSVDIWYSLHQGSSVMKFSAPSIHHSMLIPLFLMFFSFILYFVIIFCTRVQYLLTVIRHK